MNPNSPSRQNEERLSLPVNAVVDDTKSMMPGDYYDPGPGCDSLNWSDRARSVIEFNLYRLRLSSAQVARVSY